MGSNVQALSGSAIYSFKPTSILLQSNANLSENNTNNRLTIQEEEEDDELQSFGGSTAQLHYTTHTHSNSQAKSNLATGAHM